MKYYVTLQSKDFWLDNEILYIDPSKAREGSVSVYDIKQYHCYPLYVLGASFKQNKDDFYVDVLSHLYLQWKNKDSELKDLNKYMLICIGIDNITLPVADAYSVSYDVRLLPYIDKKWTIFASSINVTDTYITLEELNINININTFKEYCNKPYTYFQSYDNCKLFNKSYFENIIENSSGIKVKYKAHDKDEYVYIPTKLFNEINDKYATYYEKGDFVGLINDGDCYKEEIISSSYESAEAYEELKAIVKGRELLAINELEKLTK